MFSFIEKLGMIGGGSVLVRQYEDLLKNSIDSHCHLHEFLKRSAEKRGGRRENLMDTLARQWEGRNNMKILTNFVFEDEISTQSKKSQFFLCIYSLIYLFKI